MCVRKYFTSVIALATQLKIRTGFASVSNAADHLFIWSRSKLYWIMIHDRAVEGASTLTIMLVPIFPLLYVSLNSCAAIRLRNNVHQSNWGQRSKYELGCMYIYPFILSNTTIRTSQEWTRAQQMERHFAVISP